MSGIIGRKIGMAQVFLENGKLVPVTYIKCEPNTVYDVKTEERDGYSSLVLGFESLEKKATKTRKFRVVREIRGETSFEKDASVDVSIFEEGEKVSLSGTSKGRGFQGRVRRHGMHVARKTHGTKYIRHGSSGSICITARSQKGLRMSGRMGNDKVTLHKKEVIKVDKERNLIAIKGAVPGSVNSVVLLKKA
jgi:large subunit ribosomal protein L3